jgi:hypothetical protein
MLGRLSRTPRADQKRVIRHARWSGIQKYDFTYQEYARLRNLALHFHLKEELIAEFDKDFRFMHECPRLMRTGRFNSITGICYDIAVKNYAEIAGTIEKTEKARC